ncbi:MAG: hypothetical protein ACPLSY_03530 [Moorellaceae bacterium]
MSVPARYRVFTVSQGTVREGALVGRYLLRGAGIAVPAILIGEEGRGRKLGVLPVELLPPQWEEWNEGGSVTVYAAQVGQTKSGRPKLIASELPDSDERVIVVLRTPIGYRGSNGHTGDRVSEYWTLDTFYREDAQRVGIPIKERYTADEVREYSPLLMETHYGESSGYRWDAGFEHHIVFAPFPGEILVHGVIAQGAAGRMGVGEQYIAIIPRGAFSVPGIPGGCTVRLRPTITCGMAKGYLPPRGKSGR